MSFGRSPGRPRSNRIRPVLEPLDNRLVPAAVVLDVTTHGAEVTANGAIVRQCDAQPTGTGVIRSFLRVQATGVEQGYNTDARPLQFDENKSPQFTRSLTLGDVPVVTINGTAYREFLLDINQQASSPYLTLDELRIYVGPTAALSGYDAGLKTLGGQTSLFDLDGSGDLAVKMNYRLNAGSGAGDVFVLIPDAAFVNQPASGFVSLYCKFGNTFGANSGFEEWAVRTVPPVDQSPGQNSASLSGYVYFDANAGGTRDAGEMGIAGVTMQLQGVDERGLTVVLTTTTDANGYYEFTHLRPGLYSIFRASDPTSLPPSGIPYVDGQNTVGSLGGTDHEVDPGTSMPLDGILDIVVGRGQQGVNYNFGFREFSEPPPT